MLLRPGLLPGFLFWLEAGGTMGRRRSSRPPIAIRRVKLMKAPRTYAGSPRGHPGYFETVRAARPELRGCGHSLDHDLCLVAPGVRVCGMEVGELFSHGGRGKGDD
jgi:hypothetical protein